MTLAVQNPPADAGERHGFDPWIWKVDHREEGMETNSSILACEILWTEEAGALQVTGWQSQTQLKQLSTQLTRLTKFPSTAKKRIEHVV